MHHQALDYRTRRLEERDKRIQEFADQERCRAGTVQSGLIPWDAKIEPIGNWANIAQTSYSSRRTTLFAYLEKLEAEGTFTSSDPLLRAVNWAPERARGLVLVLCDPTNPTR